MEQPTAILSEEHEHILKVITALNNKCQSLSSQQLDKDFFIKAIDFIRNYADKFHHAKEEDILFVEMNKDSVQLDCNPIEQMLHEHDLGRNYVKGLEQGLNEDNADAVVQSVYGYSQLLQEHIDKEDNILYPMADAALSSDVQTSMLKQFKIAEEQRFSQGTKEKYIALAEALNK